MSATMTSQKNGKSPCGCGGSATKTAASCNCGCATCASCPDQGYVRPLFFAGQLLTEDDLQQLTDYVVAKSRLHARYLAGSGVVCGLEVNCEPCGGSKVIVNPGYALDCCGNDIVLSCPQTLDINQMVRDLKIKLRGGYDCGDPCAGTTTGKTASGGAASSGAYSGTSTGTQGTAMSSGNPGTTTTQTQGPAHKYCLYINYCEQPTDPVSPYATDAPCGPNTTCEPTRCLEGFRFELRCEDDCEVKSPLCDRLWGCIGDRTDHERVVRDSELLRAYGGGILEAWEKVRNEPGLSLHVGTFERRLEEHSATLKGALGTLESLERKERISETVLRQFVEAVQHLASDIAHFRVQPSDRQQEIRRNKKLSESIGNAESQLGEASGKYEQFREEEKEVLTSALERAHVATLFQLLRRILPQEVAKSARKGALPSAVYLTYTPIRFLAAGAVIGEPFQATAAFHLKLLREWLIDHLEKSAQTCCDLLKEVCAVTLPPPTSSEETIAADARMMGTAAEVLARAAGDVWRSCICNALNPPCPSCNDTGVLLACITVEDCRVKDICNAVREFVLTPVNLRYWIPEIQHIGHEIAEWCCHCECPEDESQNPQRYRLNLPGMGRTPIYVRMLLAALEAECPPPNTPRGRGLGERVSRFLESEPPFNDVTSAGFAAAGGHQVVYEAVQEASTSLKKDLTDALGELESMREEHKKLHDRIARLEQKQAKA